MVKLLAGYVIGSDDPAHPGVTLFMVDRSKQNKSFWSNKLVDVLIYQDKDAAVKKAATLKYNNPVALNWDQALAASRNNMRLAGK